MIIDFRLRPPVPGYLGTQMYHPDTIALINALMGAVPPGRSQPIASSSRRRVEQRRYTSRSATVPGGAIRPP